MGMLLTDKQRKWVNFLKEAAKKKPPNRQIRPQVCSLTTSRNVLSQFYFRKRPEVRLTSTHCLDFPSVDVERTFKEKAKLLCKERTNTEPCTAQDT